MNRHELELHNRIRLLLAAGVLLLCAGFTVKADETEYLQVRITAPYIELRTGPGRAYPVFHVIDRGELIEVLTRRTDWFLVRSARGKQGWVRRAEMEQTLSPDGDATQFSDAGFGDFTRRRWEAGVMAGDFEGADILSAYAGYHLTANLFAELQLAQMFENYSDALSASVNILAQPFPEWRLAPFFLLGTGVIYTDPKVTLADEEDRTEQIANVGLGVRWYLTRRFIVRAEYQNHVIFQDTDDNQEINEWKAGFAFFF